MGKKYPGTLTEDARVKMQRRCPSMQGCPGTRDLATVD
jgi:hypothetical protein